MRYALTGYSGFVGAALRKQLQDSELLLLGRQPPAALRKHEYFSRLDLNDESTWSRQDLQGVDCVIHCAGLAHEAGQSVERADSFFIVNHQATIALARQAATHRVRRFVFISSVKVFGESSCGNGPFNEVSVMAPVGSYALSKSQAEAELKAVSAETGLEVVIIRPPLVYGPGVKANFARLYKVAQLHFPLPVAALEAKRSYVSLYNLVDFILLTVCHPDATGAPLLISDGQSYSTSELIRLIAQAQGRQSRQFRVPLNLLRWGARIVGLTATYRKLADPFEVNPQASFNRLNWRPKYTMQATLIRMNKYDKDS